jgi:sugar lactone lactonase YvrE
LSRRARSLRYGLLFICPIIAALAAGPAPDDPPPYYFTTLAGVSHIGNADGTGSTARFYSASGVALDNAGNLWVADTYNHTIRRISPSGVVTTVAGSAGNSGSADGTGDAARFNYPVGIALDSAGNIYVADARNSTIRRVTPAGVVTTVAGSAGKTGSADGTGGDARFDTPEGVAVDASGTIYIADGGNYTIRKINSLGVVTTFAGVAGTGGSNDGTGSAAQFNAPTGLAVDQSGIIYVADTFNQTIRRITPDGAVTTLAGTPGSIGFSDGTGSVARFAYPQGLTVDAAGNVYVADGGNCTLRKITTGGVVTTVAGTAQSLGWTDGTGSAARFNFPTSVAVNASTVLYVADTYNSTIRTVTPAGAVTTFAGSAESIGSADGAGSAARFNGPNGVAVDGTGTVYIADTSNNTIRRITFAGVVTTLAGKAGMVVIDTATGLPSGNYADGTGSDVRFYSPDSVAVDSIGNVFVADTKNHVIRRISSAGVVTTFAGTAGRNGSADGKGSDARFNQPNGLAIDATGNLFVADTYNYTIRRITPAGEVTTVAGLALSSGSADGTGSAARFAFPYGLTLDASGNVYVADTYNQTIRRITPTGEVTTLAGLAGHVGSADGTGSDARFNNPWSLAADKSGNIYLADSSNHTFRRITPAGVVTTLAGKGGVDGSADGIGNSARFFYPTGVALDSNGRAYVTDSFNNTIRTGQLAAAPVTVTQPQNLSVTAGESVQFSVTAAAVPAPTYQWYFNDKPFSGATTATLSFASARNTDAGDYSVVITNELGSATSNKATLTVSASTPTPAPESTSSSGGGSIPAWFALALVMLATMRGFKRPAFGG